MNIQFLIHKQNQLFLDFDLALISNKVIATISDYIEGNNLSKVLYSPQILLKDKINILNESPVSEKMSSNIQKNEIEWYKKYSKKESIAREKLVSHVVTVLKNNPEVAAKFLSDIVSKKINCKKMPDQLIVYNHEQQKITFVYDNKELKNMCNDYTVKQTTRQKLGFYLGNFRIQIGWQNGAGLNNPTIRVFIK